MFGADPQSRAVNERQFYLETNRMDPKTPELSLTLKGSVGSRMSLNVGLMAGAKIITALFGLATLFITARALGEQAAFGIVLFVHAYMLFFASVASFQMWQAIVRFGTDHLKDKNAAGLSKLIRLGIDLDMIAACLAYIMAIAILPVFDVVASLTSTAEIANVDTAKLKKLIAIYCTLLFFRQISTSVGIFRLFDNFSLLALRAILMPTLRFIGALVAWSQGWGIVGFLCVWYLASFCSYIMLPILAFFELKRRHLLRPVFGHGTALRDVPKGVWPFIWKTNIDFSLSAFKGRFPSLLVTAVFGPAALAVFRVAEEVSKFLSKGAKLFDQVLLPELSRLVAERKVDRLLIIALKTAAAYAALSLIIAVVITLFGDPAIKLGFGDGYEAAPFLAILLLLGSVFAGVSTPFYTTLYAMTKPGLAIWVRAASVCVFLGLFFALTESQGLRAIGWAAIGAAILEVICVIAVTIRVLKTNIDPPNDLRAGPPKP